MGVMAGHPRLATRARLLLAAAALATLGLGVMPSGAAAAWDGSMDLYRSGVFSTQMTWRWCTAADVQIIRNIVRDTTNHSRDQQERFYRYMRDHNRYPIPPSDGVDPAGWAAGLRQFVDGRYKRVASDTFAEALRSAVTSLRKTRLPVGITVSHGNHAWVLTGFTATADPAKTSHFTVTSVRVVGPLWGRQNATFGYDMHPDKRLTRSQFKGFFTRWHYGPIHMAWEGKWVSVQPVGG
jgi:hypothetical protein